MLISSNQTFTLSYPCLQSNVELMGFKASRGHANLSPVLTTSFQPLCTKQTAKQESRESGEAI